MPMNAAAMEASLQPQIKTQMKNFLEGHYTGIGDDHTLGGYTFDDYLTKFSQAMAKAVATEVVAHIQANALAVGVDSGGDSHSLTVT